MSAVTPTRLDRGANASPWGRVVVLARVLGSPRRASVNPARSCGLSVACRYRIQRRIVRLFASNT